ncbi:hypothetical protein PVK06_030317 [Gossypium arboreum]|uniref:Uncharacterized protein n=1 Tax=Gossypium arboreum TaxID=29729 RepID=A0ABR0NMY2_GOSAR|nr:hypothetical protein PVK06_030317 [Gossypium arboreum]
MLHFAFCPTPEPIPFRRSRLRLSCDNMSPHKFKDNSMVKMDIDVHVENAILYAFEVLPPKVQPFLKGERIPVDVIFTPRVPRALESAVSQCLYKYFHQVFVPLTRPIEEFLKSLQPNDIQEGWDITKEDVEKMCKERRAKRLARMARKKVVERPLICLPLADTFYSIGFEHQERTSVKLMINRDVVDQNMIGDRVSMSRDWVRYDPSTLDNGSSYCYLLSLSPLRCNYF